MAMQTREFKAKSVDEAIEEGLTAFNVTRDAVDIEIINKGSRGIFGIGSEPAVVRLTLRSTEPTIEQSPPAAEPTAAAVETPTATIEAVEQADEAVTEVEIAEVESVTAVEPLPEAEIAIDSPTDDEYGESADEADTDEAEEARQAPLITDASEDELATMAADMLGELIHLMDFKAEIIASWQDEEDETDDEAETDTADAADEQRSRYLHLDVEGTDLGPLIGRRGETLDNLQYLLRLMINQKIHRWENIIIDVEHYKERRLGQLRQLADRMAEQVARTGQAISLEPMPANERRIVHMVLRDHPDVYTESYGEGPRRKVHIFARD